MGQLADREKLYGYERVAFFGIAYAFYGDRV